MKVEYGSLCDIESWMELVQQVRWNFPGLETQAALEDHRKTVLRFMREHRALCVKDEEKVIGVLLLSKKHNMICCLAVAPEYRRNGIASALLDQALSELDRSRDVTVTTFREDDEKGAAPRGLYKRFGFTEGKLLVEYDYPLQEFVLRGEGQLIIEQTLYDTAVNFIKERYAAGWGGAAVIHTEDDRYLISVAPEVFNAAAVLCIETGAICEAHKFNVKVTHCICVVRDDENSPFKVLTPCGICQERLRYWGEDVQVGVTTDDNVLKFVRLSELMPYYWGKAYPI